ncbi:MAG: RNA polymerase sigma factor [Ignavibacteriales bacterium]|nr:RNA polymerase sigma factor [Ignavibacteriales bacterium]
MKETDNKFITSLVESSKKGSRNAFMQLVEINLGNIYLLCLRMLADSKLAENLTKEVFLLSWKNIKQVRTDTSFAKWLHGFAVFTILQNFRKKNSELSKASEIQNMGRKISASSNSLERIIYQLDEMERMIFILHDIENYSVEEIADLFENISVNDIKSYLFVARNYLVEELKK